MDGDRAERPPAAAAPEPPMQRLLQDSSLYLLGNAAGRVVGFLAIPFYSRFLSPAQYGLIELVELSTQTIAIAFGLQAVGAALGRLFYDQHTLQDEQAVVSTSLIVTAVLSAVVLIMAVAGADTLSQLVFHTSEWTSLLRAAFIAMFFGNMIEVVLVYERIQNRARFFLGYTLFTLTSTLLLNILFIGVLGAGVWGFVSSKLIVTALGCIYLLFRVRRSVGFHWRSLYVPQLLKFGAPLVLSSLSYFAIHFSDRFFLSSAVSLDELGRYALAYRFAILVSALVGDSFSKSWNVTLYRYVERSDWREQFAQIASYFSYILFATGLAIALFSPELLRIMVPKAYFPPPLLLPIVILSYLAREIGDFFRTLLLINKRSMAVGNIAAFGALLNLAANLVLIPTYGIYGAAVATLITWSAYMLVCWWIANAEHRLPVQRLAYVRLFLLVCAVYAAAAATRSHVFVLQVVLDGAWLLVFCAAAIPLFFTPAERRGALALCANLVGRLLTLRTPALPDCGPVETHVLLLAYHYPPPDPSGTARPHRFAGVLRRAGTRVTVIAAPGPDGDSPDVLRVPAARPPWTERAAARTLRLVDRLFLPYDDRAAWLPAAVGAAAPHLVPGTVLVSTYPPAAAHLAALTLQHRYGLRWIADFDDTLRGNPSRPGRRAALADPVLERAIVDHADAVIASTDALAETLRSRYPDRRGRIHVIADGPGAEEALAAIIEDVRSSH